jgi:N-acetylglucosaminyldiphosphoundecaprenol N-acetyl-beta-D-mannosaminyltransferase
LQSWLKKMPSDHTQSLPRRVNILGVPVSAIDLSSAVDFIGQCLVKGRGAYVCIRDAHGVVLSRRDLRLRQIHVEADLVTPDGVPIVWMLKWLTRERVGRVYGPDLMHAVFGAAGPLHLATHFFFGGASGVAEKLKRRSIERFPHLKIAGTLTPGFGSWGHEEALVYLDKIRTSGAQIVWVGLGTPKQEYWMAQAASALPGVILIGVGAAFDFHAGIVRQAPLWMQRSGTEWIFRLMCEPRRLWRRYLKTIPIFTTFALLQLIRSPFRGH